MSTLCVFIYTILTLKLLRFITMSLLATNTQVSFDKKLESALDTLLETDENALIDEAIDDISTVSEDLSINPHVYGVKDIQDELTRENLRNALYELGIIQLNWPEIYEPEFEGRADFPHSYYTNSKKEKLLLAYAENFRQQLAHLYPESKPLLLQSPNECGLQKMVCTTIRPTKLCYAGMDTWEGCASLVADFFDYECLRKPVLLESHDFVSGQTNDSGTPPASPPPRPTSFKRRKLCPLSDAIKAIESISAQHLSTPQVCSNKDGDEFATFGQNIGQQLRSMPLEDALETQVLLQTVLTKQRIKSLRAQRDTMSTTPSSARDVPLYVVNTAQRESERNPSVFKNESPDSEGL